MICVCTAGRKDLRHSGVGEENMLMDDLFRLRSSSVCTVTTTDGMHVFEGVHGSAG